MEAARVGTSLEQLAEARNKRDGNFHPLTGEFLSPLLHRRQCLKLCPEKTVPQMAFTNQAASFPSLFCVLGLGDKMQFKVRFFQVTGMGRNTNRVSWSPVPAK